MAKNLEKPYKMTWILEQRDLLNVAVKLLNVPWFSKKITTLKAN